MEGKIASCLANAYEVLNMKGKVLSLEFANKVYNILVEHGGAVESMRSSFIYAHMDLLYPCWEYRFQGFFGFGGKYWSERNTINYYPEDQTAELDVLQDKINKLLGELNETI